MENTQSVSQDRDADAVEVTQHARTNGHDGTAADEAAETEPIPRDREAPDVHCITEVNILILDDEPMICRAVQKALERKDFVVDAVSKSTEMEGQLRSKRYHVVILDYVIPGLNFDLIISWLQELQPQAGIIVITGHPSVDSALSCLRARTFDYLTKPFQLTDLRRAVMSCLESKGLIRMSEETLREAVGNAIRERRKAQKVTLTQLAQRANLSLGYLSQIELGKNTASVETLYRISLGLGVRMADLFRSIQL